MRCKLCCLELLAITQQIEPGGVGTESTTRSGMVPDFEGDEGHDMQC